MEQQPRVWVLILQSQVQAVKQRLKDYGILDTRAKIVSSPRISDFSTLSSPVIDTALLKAIPTSVESTISDVGNGHSEFPLPAELQAFLEDQGAIVALKAEGAVENAGQPKKNILQEAIRNWLDSLEGNLKESLPCSTSDLLQGSWSFQVYPPLLLLSPSTFISTPWQLSLPALRPHLPLLYKSMCARLHVTHIAINAPIPAHAAQQSAFPFPSASNILRAPTALQPLHGSFGDRSDRPDAAGFQRTLWASARQNGIHQVFAPLHTMFARGNVKEKARVLSFPSVRGNTAVDLYAGIGYFAFSYARAGAARVLCWELNPWSVEGFRRGAEQNRWRARVLNDGESKRMAGDEAGEDDGEGAQLWMFPEDNAHALHSVKALGGSVPPVRHVNCGYLPSSELVWRDVVQMLDPQVGGWVHAHENVAVTNIEERAAEVEALMAGWQRAATGVSPSQVVRCEHVERVKSYAPGVTHCVFDVFIGPVRSEHTLNAGWEQQLEVDNRT